MNIENLRYKLKQKQVMANKRYEYYEMKNRVMDFGISTPQKLQGVQCPLGWCAKAVDTLADRISFKEFENDNLGIGDLFKMNNPDTFFDSAILSALINSCSFVYVSKDDNGVHFQVIDGGNATGTLNPITGLLEEGYAVLERDEYGQPTTEAYFTKEGTYYYFKDNEPYFIENNIDLCLLVPIIHRPDDRRPFGHSVINKACMSLQDEASRTLKRSEISAEFYSFPQKYIVGLADDEMVDLDKWSATMSALFTVGNDDKGNKPTIGQFQQQSMAPHAEQLKMFASVFAGDTGLTLDDLGFNTSNPTSAEAIKGSHENLRLKARKAQKNFGNGFLNVGYTGLCLKDDFKYERMSMLDIKPVFEPIFEPDASQLSGLGDAMIKINQAIPDAIDVKAFEKLTGISAGE